MLVQESPYKLHLFLQVHNRVRPTIKSVQLSEQILSLPILLNM